MGSSLTNKSASTRIPAQIPNTSSAAATYEALDGVPARAKNTAPSAATLASPQVHDKDERAERGVEPADDQQADDESVLAGGIEPQTAAWARDSFTLYVSAYTPERSLVQQRQQNPDHNGVPAPATTGSTSP
ncbi:hypothetical protein [Actinocrispum sp. NPDC049592]|uniref:hypothetical protein n=1 Tax=Actinocrispum sp. NPDC049592 TaxID=3154835 RepID=UPI00343DEF3D